MTGLAKAISATTLLMLAGSLAGCAGGTGNTSNAFAQMTAGPATVAFESIDGPPPHVFDRMVASLDTESRTRPITVVARENPAAYRVRSYLSAQVRGGRTTIAWVWDVYGADQNRAFRLSGEESAGKAGRDAWAGADDAVLRRIAQAGFSGLGGAIAGSPAPADYGPRGDRGPAVAGETAPSTVAMSFSAGD